jgi:TolA-binding protein
MMMSSTGSLSGFAVANLALLGCADDLTWPRAQNAVSKAEFEERLHHEFEEVEQLVDTLVEQRVNDKLDNIDVKIADAQRKAQDDNKALEQDTKELGKRIGDSIKGVRQTVKDNDDAIKQIVKKQDHSKEVTKLQKDIADMQRRLAALEKKRPAEEPPATPTRPKRAKVSTTTPTPTKTTRLSSAKSDRFSNLDF